MPPTPSPTPIEVFVHTGPGEWWQILAALGPLAVLLGAVVAAYVGWRTLKQKAEADNRAEWWKRTQWALDAVYSGDKKRGTIGLKVLKVLGESELAGDGELAVLEAASEKPLDRAAQARAAQARTAHATAEAHSPHVSTGDVSADNPEVSIPVLGASIYPGQGPAEGSSLVARARPRQPGAGVDGEPAPRDNGEDHKPGEAEGGAR
ncbi:hypothetical protein QFZ79_000200 [Arthrobacter sp. V4I6]|uniref:hypothetical protein n=1 Tax=unclassified Arthrobacter TaxID=235627 RepID=UPI002787C2E5|nr:MULTISPECIES: hypothetical protein [unclassified Arthrobacter]MDQ0822463.1 hypothetical protein [Arthrobacter sp. V1I7]MDQ0852089.1 hypothetical protein [Arthrobacter sp. V4I6]